MLIQFSVQNYKTFKDQAKITLFANYDKDTLEESNVFEVEKFGLRLLKSAAIYGANASGKTKLVDAANFMRNLVNNSSKDKQIGEPIDTDPFRLNTSTENAPSVFEVVFIHENEMYRYGFEVTHEAVKEEWLYHRPHTKEVQIFYREEQNFEINKRLFKKGDFLKKESMIKENTLLISVAAQFNDILAKKVLAWFNNFNQISGIDEEKYMGFSMSKADVKKTKMIELLQAADTGINDFELKKLDMDNLPKELPEEVKEFLKKIKEKGEIIEDVVTVHEKYNEQNESVGRVLFEMKKEESRGTRKFFTLSGVILDVLERGSVLFVDGIDGKLHPNLVRQLICLFHSTATNPRNAQLIFNTHDSNLLDNKLLRRDQIWFVEKDYYGAASLYPLSSFTTDVVRKNDNFEEHYLKGRYGGVPILQDFEPIFYEKK